MGAVFSPWSLLMIVIWLGLLIPMVKAFKFNFKVDLIDYDIPCDPSLLNKDYSAEKDEHMDGTLEAEEDSNHYKAVGKYLATS